jgi:hypothetical protein
MRKSLVLTWLVTLTGCALLPQMETHDGFSAYKPLGFAATTEPDGSWGISMAETSTVVSFRRVASGAEFQKDAEEEIASSRRAYAKWDTVTATPISTVGHLRGEGYTISIRDKSSDGPGMTRILFLVEHHGWWEISAGCSADKDAQKQLHSIIESLRISE